MKYLQLFFLFCLLTACDAPAKIKHPNFDLRLSYIDSLKVGDTLSQAYLEAFIALRCRDSLPNLPVNLDTAMVWYAEEEDNYPSTQYPLSYVFSTDTVDIFWKNDSIRCVRVPALSSKNIQVYACKIGQRGIHIRTHKPNPSDKNNLIEFLLHDFLQKKISFWLSKQTDIGNLLKRDMWVNLEILVIGQIKVSRIRFLYFRNNYTSMQLTQNAGMRLPLNLEEYQQKL